MRTRKLPHVQTPVTTWDEWQYVVASIAIASCKIATAPIRIPVRYFIKGWVALSYANLVAGTFAERICTFPLLGLMFDLVRPRNGTKISPTKVEKTRPVTTERTKELNHYQTITPNHPSRSVSVQLTSPTAPPQYSPPPSVHCSLDVQVLRLPSSLLVQSGPKYPRHCKSLTSSRDARLDWTTRRCKSGSSHVSTLKNRTGINGSHFRDQFAAHLADRLEQIPMSGDCGGLPATQKPTNAAMEWEGMIMKRVFSHKARQLRWSDDSSWLKGPV
ncbi:hypothetical protein BC830DRAFT_26991 [Chytriomyces sp. MP71]|nr:hypothetical protein BC830DRAFT_26991 [Chytriomyces sp. MP71]